MNEISKTLEIIKSDIGFTDLIDTNFLEFSVKNKLNIPTEIIQKEIEFYFNNHSYKPDIKGLLSTREAISNYYRDDNINIDKENLIITASTSESYSQIFSNFTSPGDEVLFPNPSYPLFEYLAKYAHITPRFYKLDEKNRWKIDFKTLENLINSKTKGIVLISPNNPTGMVLTKKEIAQIETIASKHNLFIIFDEVFSEFRIQKDFPRPLSKSKNPIFLLNGISKMLALPDLKLAWISVICKDTDNIIDKLETSNDTYLNANYLTQYIFPKVISFRKKIAEKINEVLNKNRNFLHDLVTKDSTKISGFTGLGGIHVVLKIKTKLSEENLVLKLLKEEKISVHPGYYYDIKTDKAYSNIVISLLKDNSNFKKALNTIVKIV